MLDPRRDSAVTGSEIPTICGENMYKTPAVALREKILNIRHPDTAATLHGKRYEPIAIAKYRKELGVAVTYPKYATHPQYPWIGGTVDGISTYPDGRTVLLEVKCPISRQIGDGAVPVQYEGQLQIYMDIFSLYSCDFVQYKPAGVRKLEQLSVTTVERDVSYLQQRLMKIYTFWVSMTRGKALLFHAVSALQRAWRHDRKNNVPMARRIVAGCVIGKMVGVWATKDNAPIPAVLLPLNKCIVETQGKVDKCQIVNVWIPNKKKK